MESGNGNVIELRQRAAYFTFGRFQPPTLGHGLLIGELASAAETADADAYVFVSSTQDKKKNPLTVFQKVTWLQRMFPTINARFINTTTCLKGYVSEAKAGCRTIFAIVDALRSAGYETIKMFVGSDRVGDFSALLSKGEVGVEVVGIGAKRVEGGISIAAVSGTKMRAAAAIGDLAGFAAGTGLPEWNAAELMAHVQAGMTGGKYRKTYKRRRLRRKTLKN